MKKILISDYDNTFYCKDENVIEKMKENVEAVEKFRKEGNIFVIATARDPESIRQEIETYNIKCDYVISYIGGVIQKENEVIYVNYIDEKIIEQIENILKNYTNIIVKRMGLEEKIAKNKIIGYNIDTKGDLAVIKSIEEKFKENKDLFLRTFDNIILYINNSHNSKVKSIKYLINLLKIEKSEIYTIGDFDDDLEMLLEFNGYRMENSSEALAKKINNKVSSVAELLKII